MEPKADPQRRNRRILVKLSGEALMGDSDYGIDPAFLRRLATEIRSVQETGTEIGVVVGGGNLFRGAGLARAGMDRVTGDHRTEPEPGLTPDFHFRKSFIHAVCGQLLDGVFVCAGPGVLRPNSM